MHAYRFSEKAIKYYRQAPDTYSNVFSRYMATFMLDDGHRCKTACLKKGVGDGGDRRQEDPLMHSHTLLNIQPFSSEGSSLEPKHTLCV